MTPAEHIADLHGLTTAVIDGRLSMTDNMPWHRRDAQGQVTIRAITALEILTAIDDYLHRRHREAP